MAVGEWIHACCDSCWSKHGHPGFGPARIRASDADGNTQPGYRSEPCCFCGQPTRGIYIRRAAHEVHGVPA
jgi:hypothetical protein